MFCPKCGAENAAGNQSCQKCGAAIPAEAPQPAESKVFCPKCGAEVTGGNKFCPKCGSPVATGVAGAAGSTTSLEPNIAGLLCYLVGWITGLIFILIEKENKFVRFHAMQSIVVFGALNVVAIIFSFIPVVHVILGTIVGILGVILWIVLMIKAYQGEKIKLPIAGDIAEKNS